MAAVMAHHLKDGEFAGTGAGSAVARAACRLAQLTHAPNLTYLAGGSGAINPELDPLVASSCDFANYICEAVITLDEVILSLGREVVDVFFCGALQVDQFGNANLSLVGNDYTKPLLRGPGAVALPLLANLGRTVVFLNDHNPRALVEKVSFRTLPGYLEGGDSWRKAKADGLLKGEGISLVITNLAIMDFEEEAKRMRLVSVHPGVTVEQVKAATGFELIIPQNVPTTTPPTETEVQILRRLDQTGLLRV
jgi:glutaconate CoA-transferase subunit B